jgi:hypothetical protein
MAKAVTEEPDHAGLLRPFLASRFRSRYGEVPPGSPRRAELLNKLAHRYLEVLDWRYAGPLLPLAPPALAAELCRLGAAGHCYCLCTSSEWDGRDAPLAEAVAALSGSGLPVLLVCRPGALAYFEPEHETSVGQRFLLRRPAA